MRKLIAAGLAAAALFGSADAAVWRFEMTGFLQPGDSLGQQGQPAEEFGALTAFTFRAVFDDEGTVYRAGPPGSPLPGYAAYAFERAVMEIGGVSYDVTSFVDDPDHGVTVALFDPSNVFNPGFYAGGFFGNPLGVGPGMIARFDAAEGDWNAVDPVAAALDAYLGYGAISGPTIDGGPGFVCQEVSPDLCSVIPIFLRGPGGEIWELTLLSAAYPTNGEYAFTVGLTAIPLPGAAALFAGGLAAFGAVRRRALRTLPRV